MPKKNGRPPHPIDWQSVEAMCQIQCTQDEIAAVVGCNLTTLQNRCLSEKKVTFSDFFKEKRQGGKASLRRTQWQMAKTNPTLAIFLGKNYLGQADKTENTHRFPEPVIFRNPGGEIYKKITFDD